MFDSLSKSMSKGGLMASRFTPSAPSISSSTSPHHFSASTKSVASSTLTNSSSILSRNNNLSTNNNNNINNNNNKNSSTNSSLSTSSSGRKTLLARVMFLDDSFHTFEVDKKSKGSVLLESVFNHLELTEREYFGLVFCDTGGPLPLSHSPEVSRWLDAHKMIKKQTKNAISSNTKGSLLTLYFRVKFYVTDPSQLKEEFTRYHVYLQVRKDLMEGRLKAPSSTLCLLTSYVVQSTVGDYDPDMCHTDYLTRFNDLKKHCIYIPEQDTKISSSSSLNDFIESNEEVDRRITELHKLHKGQNPADSEFNFLEHAKRLEMFGINLHNGKDSNGRDIQLGVTCIGLVVFQNNLRINTFSWSKIVKISFKRKQFFIQLRKELTEDYDTLLGFNLTSYRSCKNLWKSAVEHHSFFRLHSSPRINNATPSTSTAPRRFLMTLGSRFRYSSRHDIHTSPFGRSHSKSFSEELPLNLETPVQNSANRVPRLASPETSSIGSSVHSNGGSLKPSAPIVTPIIVENTTTTPSERGHSSSGSLAHRAIESFNHRVQSLSTKLPKKAWQEDIMSDDEGGFLDSRQRNVSSLSRLSKSSNPSSSSSIIKPKQQSIFQPTLLTGGGGIASSLATVRLAYADESSLSTTASTQNSDTASNSVISSSTLTNGDNSPFIESLKCKSTENMINNNQSILSDGESGGGLVYIKIFADEFGRFGFNVKGGADQDLPIIVSRVGPNTPADTCYPKLNEGDQVVLINGRDVSNHTHDQVVSFIRACSEPHSRQLILAVRQNVYIGEDVEEPEFQYVPETPRIVSAPPGTQALSQSMLLLEESLESGAINGQFEQLYRRNPNLSITECHKIDNLSKNRYRDISPYDKTRVNIRNCPSGDYINANHVVMTVPGSGIINRYIATQGPLSTTCPDFWFMIWDAQTSLIIMLTTIVEQGRVKCHKYWPDLDEKMEFESTGLVIKCIGEKKHDNFAFRDFTLINKEGEERSISQMAYLSWPDHGVPESSDEFVDFVETVRTHRAASINPTVVHCSAGIGRTGVLILMETAVNLIEANQPVYPLDLTRVMRDQRASMIQTPTQYRFVCQAILKVYKEGKVKPLPEFCVT
ncbi:LOW QUALITY PROTEIN: tyrosine-protein phosphatase non-receptor type 4-like [Lepeophtheirus salmonis]|uniref:LOW QUALITY PROTEIN: tyrosine-protein phosphatase non-receptor type 4-like n=1 Tax=Lepeophtheirus salmonis TaxID=72036 RepID=UPI003AF36C17